MTGEFLYFTIYVAQQLGVMLGVGAQTVLLCAHLLSVHRGEDGPEHLNYSEAARKSLLAGLFLIVISGAAAVGVHVLGGNTAVLFAPAFLFKWALIAVALGAFWFHNHLSHWSNTLAGFAGGNWYALFLVHSLAPVAAWLDFAILYVAWLVLFGAFWAAFVFFMRKPARVLTAAKVAVAPVARFVAAPPKAVVEKVVAPTPTPVLIPVPIPAPIVPKTQPAAPARPSLLERFFVWIESFFASKAAPVVAPALVTVPTPAPKPVPPPPPIQPVIKPVPPPPPPPPPKPIPPAPLLPQEPHLLSLPVRAPVVPVPAAPVAPAAAKPAVEEKEKHTMLQDVIDHLFVPALRIMPQKAEDIGKQNRPPVVKLGGK